MFAIVYSTQVEGDYYGITLVPMLDYLWASCLTARATLESMSTDAQLPDLTDDPGVLMGTNADEQQRQYAWGERAAEIRRLSLKYPELSQAQIASMVGCSHQRVSQVLAEFLADTSPEHIEDFRTDKASILETIQYRMLATITQDKLEKQSALQLVTGAAIIQDKLQLLRGQPTSIQAHMIVDVLDALRTKEGEW